jgi:hypothetical protein
MVIPPEKSREFTEEETKIFAELDKGIEAKLANFYDPYSTPFFFLPDGMGKYENVVREIVSKYRSEGWDVRRKLSAYGSEFLYFRCRLFETKKT